MEVSEQSAKDVWDKVEIAGKVAVPLTVAVIAAVGLYLWNTERTVRQTAATMTEIAVAILTEQPEVEDGQTDPLREWAISVLQTPEAPPPLSDEAAARMKEKALPSASLTPMGRINELEVAIEERARIAEQFDSDSGERAENVEELKRLIEERGELFDQLRQELTKESFQ